MLLRWIVALIAALFLGVFARDATGATMTGPSAHAAASKAGPETHAGSAHKEPLVEVQAALDDGSDDLEPQSVEEAWSPEPLAVLPERGAPPAEAMSCPAAGQSAAATSLRALGVASPRAPPVATEPIRTAR